jgi:radical SAM superfamily enzyme YgiQ (UPF0313 family)
MSVDCVFTKYAGPVKCFDQFFPDLGLAYLSSALKQQGYTRELFDLDLLENSVKDLLDYLGRYKPSILAVKLLRPGFLGLIKIVEEAKKISPTTLIIGGGPHARLCQETILEFTNAFDALLVGESDRAITQMIEVAHGERDLRDVENVVFRCAFCNCNYIRASRKRSLQSLQREILYCIDQYGIRLFGLADPLPDIKLTNQLSDWLIDSKTITRWISFGRIKYMDRILEKMARAGWVALWFGIESGSEKILRHMNKLYTVEDIRGTINAVQKAGIKRMAGFIMGFPGEDESTLAETFRLSQELPLDGFIFSPFVLVPGSTVAEIPENYGVKPHEDWMKVYTYASNLRDTPYFDIDGEDNVAMLKRFNPLIHNAYKKYRHYRLIDVSDYAELIASVMEGMSAEDILWETDALLNSRNVRGWNAFLSRVWRATENIS